MKDPLNEHEPGDEIYEKKKKSYKLERKFGQRKVRRD